ncbi:hypothetical protein [Mycobacterium deserti]|uniref:Uncharacterized protein n=1 Tax=Mycobacterium deserti TaxID=2978347 RepID=A0ABT2MEI5_9MYCO|nr:hypothetical protein [Mycobacterium deserti]MCT7659401.1 hypothetical protein [Mycobacterium deserti]
MTVGFGLLGDVEARNALAAYLPRLRQSLHRALLGAGRPSPLNAAQRATPDHESIQP